MPSFLRELIVSLAWFSASFILADDVSSHSRVDLLVNECVCLLQHIGIWGVINSFRGTIP